MVVPHLGPARSLRPGHDAARTETRPARPADGNVDVRDRRRVPETGGGRPATRPQVDGQAVAGVAVTVQAGHLVAVTGTPRHVVTRPGLPPRRAPTDRVTVDVLGAVRPGHRPVLDGRHKAVVAARVVGVEDGT